MRPASIAKFPDVASGTGDGLGTDPRVLMAAVCSFSGLIFAGALVDQIFFEQSHRWPLLFAALLALTCLLPALLGGFVQASARLFVIVLFASSALPALASGGVSGSSQVVIPTFAAVAAILLPRREAMVCFASFAAALLMCIVLRRTQWVFPLNESPWVRDSTPFRVPIIMCLMSLLLVRQVRNAIYERMSALNEARRTAREAQERTKRAVALYENYSEMTGDWFWETDEHLRVQLLSPGFEARTGTSPDVLLGRSALEYAELQAPAPDNILEHAETLKNHRPFENHRMTVTSGEAEKIYHCSGLPRFDGEGQFLGYRVVARDVTQLYEARGQLRLQAQKDALTGVTNVRAFKQSLSEAVAEAADPEGDTFLLCFLDLDYFGRVNESAGHLAGDALLKGISDLLQKNLRAGDVVARMGGDEFCVLCRMDRDADADLPERLREALAQFEFVWDGTSHRVGASIGVVQVGRHTASAEQVLGDAVEACNRAKSQGRNLVVRR